MHNTHINCSVVNCFSSVSRVCLRLRILSISQIFEFHQNPTFRNLNPWISPGVWIRIIVPRENTLTVTYAMKKARVTTGMCVFLKKMALVTD